MSPTKPIATPLPQRIEDFKRRTLPVIVWVASALVVAMLMFSRGHRFEYIGVANLVEYEIAAEAAGRVQTVAVELFDAVDAGDIVAVLDDTAVKASLDTARGTVARLQAELEAERDRLEASRESDEASWTADLRRFQIDEESRRLDALGLRVVIESDRVELERLELDLRRATPLLEAGFLSDGEYDDLRLLRDQVEKRIDENTVLLARTHDELRNAENRRVAYERSSPRSPALGPALAALEQAVAEESRRLAEIEIQRHALALRSPANGQVSRILARQGAAVVAGEPILMVADPTVREVIAYLRPSERSLVSVDGRVRVSSPGGRTATDSVVVRVGPGLLPLPTRLWNDPRVPDYGYPVVIAATPAMRLTPGELVSIRFLDR